MDRSRCGWRESLANYWMKGLTIFCDLKYSKLFIKMWTGPSFENHCTLLVGKSGAWDLKKLLVLCQYPLYFWWRLTSYAWAQNRYNSQFFLNGYGTNAALHVLAHFFLLCCRDWMKVPDAGVFALEICGSCSIYIPNVGEVALII